MKNNRVLLGLSGGVDSTAAALLLKQQEYEVIGYYFDVLGTQVEGLEKARRAAQQLGIEFVHRTVVNEFEENVIQPFCDAGRSGPRRCCLAGNRPLRAACLQVRQ